MNIDFYIRLTLAVYKVTELFPEGTSLKQEIRNSANEILVDLINCQRGWEALVNHIETLEEYFDRAQAQNWVDGRNFLVLRREYDRIKQEALARKRLSTMPRRSIISKRSPNKTRQENILKTLRENGKVKVGDLIKLFPGVNRRTLLRDLESFRRAGLIEKNGNGRGVYYLPKNTT